LKGTIKKALCVLLVCALCIGLLGDNQIKLTFTSKAADTQNSAEKINKTFVINMHRPFSATTPAAIVGSAVPNIYAFYYDEVGKKIELQDWPGEKMDWNNLDDDGYWYTTSISAPCDKLNVIFTSGVSTQTTTDPYGNTSTTYDCGYVFPTTKEGEAQKYFTITGDVWYNPLTMTEPQNTEPERKRLPTQVPVVTTAPAVTAIPTPTVVPTDEPVILPTTEPVVGPQIIVDGPTSYYQEEYDSLPVTVSLANGATSSKITIDDGAETIIKETQVIKVGTGKIANSIIKMTAETTNGTTTTTQHFYFYKRTKVASPSKAEEAKATLHLSTAMLRIFTTVKATAVTEQTYKITYHLPSENNLSDANKVWTAPDSHIYAYAYYDKYITKTKKTTLKPLGIWPGTLMNKVDNKTYNINVSTETSVVSVIFVCVKGEVGEIVTPAPVSTENPDAINETHRTCTVISQYPNGKDGEPIGGYTITEDTDFYADQLQLLPSATKPAATIVPVTNSPVTLATPEVPGADVSTNYSDTAAATVSENTAIPTIAPLKGYFGADVAGPQYAGTKLTISAIPINARGTLNYTFAVNGSIIGNSASNNCIWDTTGLKAGNYTLSVVISDVINGSVETVSYEKTYPISEKVDDGNIVTPPPIIETPAPTEIPTTAPYITDSPAVSASVEPTPNITTAPAIKASLSFSKASKKATEGETIKVTTSLKNADTDVHYYTYKIKIGNKTTTLANKIENSSLSFTLTKAGTCKISVVVYNANKEKLCSKSVNYVVGKRVISIPTITPASCKVNKTTTITYSSTVTKGTTYYKLTILNSKNKKVLTKGLSKKTKTTWKPTKKGTYTINLTITNKKGVTITYSKKIKVK
jgi:hypothetical protein